MSQPNAPESPGELSLTAESASASSPNDRQWGHLYDGYFPVTPPDHELPCGSERNTPAFGPVDPDAELLVAVIGVGYVGEHLVNAFSKRYDVIGFDVSAKRIFELREEYAKHSRARFTSDAGDLAEATHILIAVPTLLLPDKKIDCKYLRGALETVAIYARAGATVVIESSVAVGMTRELLGPLAAAKRLLAGMSPEVRLQPAPISRPKVSNGGWVIAS